MVRNPEPEPASWFLFPGALLASAVTFELGARNVADSLPAHYGWVAPLFYAGAIVPIAATSLAVPDVFNSDAYILHRMRGTNVRRLTPEGEPGYWIMNGLFAASAAFLAAAAFNQSPATEIAAAAVVTGVNLNASRRRFTLKKTL